MSGEKRGKIVERRGGEGKEREGWGGERRGKGGGWWEESDRRQELLEGKGQEKK